jgi:anti-sigma regulatory factor (Ser/Thr protein kinase)
MAEKTFTAVESKLREMIFFIKEESKILRVRDDFVKKIHVIAEEVITNIINHGYNSSDSNIGQDNTILIRICLFEQKNLKLVFIDTGTCYNLNETAVGPMTEPQIGGLGAYFIKKFADDIIYKRENNRNILEVVLRDVLK